MEDVKSERRTSRRKRKLSTRQGVVIGVATVAGLGLMTKLLSFLRRETQPKKVKDDDIETLEAVLNGDAAKGALPPQTAEVHMFANLENDEPQHELLNGHDSSPPSSKDAHSDVTEKDGYVTLAEELASESGDEIKPHIEDAVELHSTEDVRRKLNGDALEVLDEDAEKLNTEDEGNVVEDAVELQGENEAQPHSEDAVEQLIEDAEEVEAKDEEKYQEGAGELQTEGEGKLHSEEVEALES